MNVLIVAAHPDDEVLGVGGTLAKHVLNGDSVSIVIVGEGATSRHRGQSRSAPDEVKALREFSVLAAQTLGANPPTFLGMPDNRLDSVDRLDLIQSIEAEFRKAKPQVVYTHHWSDINIDHRIVHEAVITAARPLPGNGVSAIFCFETVSSTEWGGNQFRPQRFVDIAGTLESKMKALHCYSTEMRQFPHPRSYEAVEAWARVRGASSGLAAAEAFEIVRDVWK